MADLGQRHLAEPAEPAEPAIPPAWRLQLHDGRYDLPFLKEERPNCFPFEWWQGDAMLQVFGFDRVGVVLGDIYFVDPSPEPGQEGAERGVRLEVRFLECQEAHGSVYASRPILVGQPIWRADLLESVQGKAGSFDRTHHHPQMRGWEPGGRRFERGLSADPLGWVAERLQDLPGLVAQAELPADRVTPEDVREMRASTDAIVAAAGRLLDRIRAGELARAPVGTDGELARTGWL